MPTPAAPPELSVIVPAHRCADQLRRALRALRESDLERERWELIVVDDASGDDTAEVAAEMADRVVQLTGGARGPGHARNRGVSVARAPVVAFVDADVLVHRDALRLMLDAFASTPRLGAVFGAYDAHPAAPGIVSRYRNLLHRITHEREAGPVTTFWAGCGAIRRDAFLGVGGFDTVRYPRPSIEDVELGYRLSARGWPILLRPAIQGTHLKRWTLGGMIVTDVTRRGVPWVELLLADRSARAASTLNVSRGERAYTALTALAWLALVGAVALGEPLPLALAGAGIGVVLAGNLPLLVRLGRMQGAGFALAVVPLRLLYYSLNVVSLLWGGVRHLTGRGSSGARGARGAADRCAAGTVPTPSLPASEPEIP